MAQQAPLSNSLTVQNSAACPLTLANGFIPCSATTAQTLWGRSELSRGLRADVESGMQRDLPGSLQMVATYLGIKGTRGVQEFLPNTYPPGAANPCPSCPLDSCTSRRMAILRVRRGHCSCGGDCIADLLHRCCTRTRSRSMTIRRWAGRERRRRAAAIDRAELARSECASAGFRRSTSGMLLSIFMQYTRAWGWRAARC